MILTLLASGDQAGLLEQLGINLKVLGTQVVIFVITFLVLSRLLFGRVLDHMTQREEEVRRSQEALKRDQEEAARLTQQVDAHLAKVDREAYDRMQALLKEALATAAGIVARAQEEAKRQVEQARAEIAREKQAAAGQLRSDVTRLTLAAAEKILDSPLDPAVHGALVQKFVSERF